MLRSLFLAFSTIAIANAGTFGECSCKFKDGHVQKFQVSDCKASACYIECRQNAGGIQESCITKNEDRLTNSALAMALAPAISCDACFAKFADLPADDQAKICTKVLKCVPAQVASSGPMIPCDKCIAKFADDIPADDAQFICTKVVKCNPVKAVMPCATVMTAPAGGDGANLG